MARADKNNMARKNHIVAGSFRNRVQDAPAQVLPEPTKAAMRARETEPGSGKKGGKKR